MISKAKWFTKLNVSAVFHKIHIAEDDKWLTVFRIWYGLYEWLVIFFGLAGASSTFQKYINNTLREYLNWFCSAYLDDVLIFIDDSKKEHTEHIRKILKALKKAGLNLNISKCEFSIRITKYLDFIIKVEKNIRINSEKIKVIQE